MTAPDITSPLVLSGAAILERVADLPPATRRRLRASADDYIVAAPTLRARRRLIDGEAARLLGAFTRPTRIADAVYDFARERQVMPEAVLERAYPMLREFIADGLLVARSEDAPQGPTLSAGTRVAGAVVTRCLQSMADTEVYELRRGTHREVLKIVRDREPDLLPCRALAHEAAVLARLRGRGAPALLGSGLHEGRLYLRLEFRAGRTADAVAREWRGAPDEVARLRALAIAVVRAYARLHAAGVIHADVHPGNVLVDEHRRVSLVDFGLATVTEKGRTRLAPGLGGVPPFYAPEQADALARGEALPRATLASEQHVVAALIYALVAGGHHVVPATLREADLLDAIAAAPPLPFARHGVPSWPSLERILARSLAKRPDQRFPSLAAFGDGLRRTGAARRVPRLDRRLERDLVAAASDRWLEGHGLPAPSASVYYGAAGLACALHRLACAGDDGPLAALADLWQTRAERWLAEGWELARPGIGVPAALAGGASVYHGAAGIHLNRALMARAWSDTAAQSLARDALLELVRHPGESRDLAFGRAGSLLACAQLREALLPSVDVAALEAAGEGLVAAWARSILGDGNRGLAHGAAGGLYAALRWRRAIGQPPPAIAARRLAGLAARRRTSAATPPAHYAPVTHAGDGIDAGWCHGSAGFVHLWLLAHDTFGDARFIDLAQREVVPAWSDPSLAWDLCCGWAGRAYALLAFYRHTGETAWLSRARQLAARAVNACRVTPGGTYPHSLFRGATGVAVLAAELAHPELARMPLFE